MNLFWMGNGLWPSCIHAASEWYFTGLLLQTLEWHSHFIGVCMACLSLMHDGDQCGCNCLEKASMNICHRRRKL